MKKYCNSVQFDRFFRPVTIHAISEKCKELTASKLTPLRFYNGEKGVTHTGKYFFYIFYPAHFVILSLLKLWIGS